MKRIIDEKRIHPRKYYYLKDPIGNARITSHPNPKNPNYMQYYVINEHHQYFINFMDNLSRNLETYEAHFKEYSIAALYKEPAQIDACLSILIDDMKTLHPFFTKQPAEILYFLQRCIQNHFLRKYEFYLKRTIYELYNTCKNSLLIGRTLEQLQLVHKKLHTPIITYLTQTDYRHSLPSEKDLWGDFIKSINSSTYNLTKHIQHLTQELATDSFEKEPSISLGDFTIPNDTFLKSLLNLQMVIDDYAYGFSSILLHNSKISRAQSYCLFLTHHHSNIIESELQEQRVISEPTEIYKLFTSSIYHDPKNPSHILIDDETTLFDQQTNFAYQKLYSLANATNTNEYSIENIQADLNTFLPQKMDDIFDMEIHEFYRFEQLIYMELLDLVKNKFFLCKCNRSNCTQFFVSKSRKRKYCKQCSSTRLGSDQTYRESISPLQTIKNRYYNKYYYQINKLNSPTKEYKMDQLFTWTKEVQKLINEYTITNRENDVESFEKELPQPF